MNSFLGKTPFFRLLLPVITGIILCSLFPNVTTSMLIPALLGLIMTLLSFFIKKEIQFKYRWIFGVGVVIFILSLTHFQYHKQEQSSQLNLSDNNLSNYYIGNITDIPEVKPRSIGCNVKISAPITKKVIIYFEQTDEAAGLQPGDEVVFYSKLEPFQNFGNPDDFDYPCFMKIRGFSGTSYVPAKDWVKTGRQSLSLSYISQRVRAKALNFYRSFELSNDAYAFISALTLGYKKDLSENMQEAFRASGTAHVLAVSGLHVGIIYLVINLMFSFLGKRGKPYIIRQLLVIIVLWGYVFIVGMSASVVRAAIMLSINCVGKMNNKKGFTFNTLAAAAFIILIYHPFTLFDISFQMSFGAVLSLIYFQPKLYSLYKPPGRVMKYIWNMSTVSLSAQLGVFPFVLYYFGTFPTYFFLSNIIVVPLVGLIIYVIPPLIILALPIFMKSSIIELMRTLLQWIANTLIELTLQIVYFTETLPFAQLSNFSITLAQTLIILLFIYIFTNWLSTKRPRPLISALILSWVFLLSFTYDNSKFTPPKLVVFNSRNKSEISLYYNNRRHYIDIPENGLIPHQEKSIFRLSDSSILNYYSEENIRLDILILSNNNSFNIEKILNIFNPSTIVLDSSLPSYFSKNVITKCKVLGIEVHDVTKDGAFSVNI